MIRANDLTAELGGRAILEAVSFTVAAGRTLGIVGPNGSGKTTLLRVLADELRPDRGRSSLDGARAGYLRQVGPEHAMVTLGQRYPSLFAAETLETALAAASERLARASGSAATEATEAYDELLDRLARIAPREIIEEARVALELRPFVATAPARGLSGGEIAKLALLDLTAAQPEALLLDEPTNHLDLAWIEWLDRYLGGYAGPIVLVSHDRALLDDHVDQLLILADHAAGAELFSGDYSTWLKELARRREEESARYQRQRREERKMRRAIQAAESRAKSIEQRTIDFHYRKRALKVARRAVTLKARLQREHDRGSGSSVQRRSSRGSAVSSAPPTAAAAACWKWIGSASRSAGSRCSMTRALSSSEAIGWCSLGPTAVARPRCCARWRANWRWAAAGSTSRRLRASGGCRRTIAHCCRTIRS